MSENVVLPYSVYKNLTEKLDYLTKIVEPLVRSYKAPKWMTEAEVLETLSIGKSRLRQLKASGKLEYRKPVGGRVCEYSRKDIEAYKNGDLIIQ